MDTIITTYLYQPFFNLLIGIYWLVGKLIPPPDMGVAMIFFAIAVRLIFLPIDLLGERSDKEKIEISDKVKKIKVDYAGEPIRMKEEIKRTIRQKPGAIFSEIFNTVFQVVVIVMLYRIFTTGLEGADLPLIYKFMPQIQTPINLMFLGIFDLSRTNNTLNIIQSVMIALNEAMHLYFEPVAPDKKDFVSLVIIFPVVCFVLFLFLPAGKKVYIITSLAFTMVVRIAKQASFLLHSAFQKAQPAPVESKPETPSEALPSMPTPTSEEKQL